MVGLPGQKLIDPRFQSYTAQMIASTFRSAGRLTRLGNPQGVRDPTTGRTTFPVPYIVYEGAARVQSRGPVVSARAGGETAQAGGHTITVGAYLVALPSDSEPGKIGDTFTVTTCPDNRSLESLTLVVVEVPAADIAWQRSYGCNLQEPTSRG